MAVTRPLGYTDTDINYLKNYFTAEHDELYTELLSHYGKKLFESLFKLAPENHLKDFFQNKSDEFMRDFFRVARHYAVFDVSFINRMFYYTSDFYNSYSGQENYVEVVPGLFLGRFPHSTGFEKIISELGLLVSVTEDYEPEFGAEYWEKNGVKQIAVPIEDRTSEFSPQEIVNTCMAIKEFLDREDAKCKANPDYQRKIIYTHCKAGRSRSGAFVLAFLAMYGHPPEVTLTGDVDKDMKNSLLFLQKKRPNLLIESDKLERVREALTIFNKHVNQEPHKYQTICEYLASSEGKSNICDLTSFRAIREYAIKEQSIIVPNFIKPCYRTNHVREFFSEILFSKDGGWYNNLNELSAVKNFLNADKSPFDNARRRTLVEKFIAEVDKLLVSKNLKVAEPELQKASGLLK